MGKRALCGWTVTLAAVALLGLAGCGGSRKNVIDCQFMYEKEAITVSLTATADLNRFNNQPHTVVVVFYQLSDPNIFNQMLESADGVGRLLEGKSFDASVLSRRTIVVQPSDVKELRLDRVEGTRYLGVIAGFYEQQPEGFYRLFPVPTRKTHSLFGAEKDCFAEPLAVKLTLGSDGFVRGE